MQTQLSKGDLFLIALCLCCALALLALPFLPENRQGAYLVVTNHATGGKETLPLAKDTVQAFEGNGYTLTVVIEHDKASVSQSDCPDGICMSGGTIWRRGESLVCAPAGIVLTVTNGEEVEVDAIVG